VLRSCKPDAGQRLAALLVASCLLGPGVSRALSTAPNVILISIDTLRADHLGCYGYARPTSPALDRFANGGWRFTDASAPSPWTRPSHASLLTGLYPSRHGVRAPTHALSDRVATLAEWFAAAGYATKAIVNSEHLGERFGLQRGFADFDYVSEWSRWPPWRRHIVDSADVITDRALRDLAAIEGQPLFLFLHYYDVHSDYDPSPHYRSLFAGPYAGSLDGGTTQLLEIQRSRRALSEEDRDHLVDLYDAEIRQLDTELGRLFAFLAESGLAKTTIVAITADHGEEFLDHGSVLHGRTLYQEVIAVPLILRGPGIPAAGRVTQVASTVDVAPTLLSLAGLPTPAGLDGIDLSRDWNAGAVGPSGRAVFAEADENNVEPDVKRMVRRGRWKLYYDRHAKTSELYDLVTDPGERMDRGQAEPRAAGDLFAELERFMSGARAVAEPVVIPPAARERLRSLGYD
jgi:arylsulfatase A-like enzyme